MRSLGLIAVTISAAVLCAHVAQAALFFPKPIIGFAQSAEARSYRELCPGVRVKSMSASASASELTPRLTDMEVRLVCGDPSADPIAAPWASVPPNQAAYFLIGFLQTRGYHHPSFIQDGDILFVDPGEMARLAHFRVTGGPATWEPPKRRLVEGQPLTPTLLDELEGWALGQIKNEGYACAEAKTRADPSTQEVEVEFQPGGARVIAATQDTGDSGLREGVLDRYNAFRIGDLYRDDLIALTRKRTQDDGFLQTYVMNPRCGEDPAAVTIVRDVVLGPSRTVRIGVGASTDAGARLRGLVRQSRIGDSASSAQARLNLSYLNNLIHRQIADLNFRWFYSLGEPRSYLEPSLTFDHTGEAAFENQSLEAKLLHGWNRELTDGQFEMRVGPTFLDSKLFRGAGPSDVSVTFVETGVRWASHRFEYFATSPRSGESLEASALLTLKKWGANFTAQKLQLQGEKLWEVFRYDPPLFILGLRFNFSSVFSPGEDLTADLPVRFLTFLGGDQDLRGFERGSLPRSGVGALSGATVSGEARLHKVIWRRADVFTFLDAGLLGGARFALRPPYLMSPGVGLRWESPIGVLRGFIAQRFALHESAGDLPYGRDVRLGFTFGEEF